MTINSGLHRELGILKDWRMKMAELEGHAEIEAGVPPQSPEILLTIARILPARLPDMPSAYVRDNVAALIEELAPFHALRAEPINGSP